MLRKRILITRQRVSVGSFSAENSSKEKVGGLNPLPPSYGGEGGFIRGRRSQVKTSEQKSLVAEILEQTQKLTAKQKQELLDQLSLASKMTRSAGEDRDLDMWATAVHNVLSNHANPEGASGYGSLLVKRLLGLSQNWRPIQEFMEQSGLRNLKVPERASVYQLLAELLVKHAEGIAARSGIPLGPKLIGNCSVDVAGVFEQAFPGYLRAGLAKVAAVQLIKGVNNDDCED